jgi:hypothetical protein
MRKREGDFLPNLINPILSNNRKRTYTPNGRNIIGMVKTILYETPTPGPAQRGKDPIAEEMRQYIKKNNLLFEGRILLKPK